MKNHIKSFEGYNSDNNLPYYDQVADMGYDPGQYDEDPIQFSQLLPPSNNTTNSVEANIVSKPQMTDANAKALDVS